MFDCLHFSKFAKWREYAMSHLWEVSLHLLLVLFLFDLSVTKKKKKTTEYLYAQHR